MGNNNNWTFVIAAYVVAWVVIAGYLVRVHRLLREARRSFERAGASVTGPTS